MKRILILTLGLIAFTRPVLAEPLVFEVVRMVEVRFQSITAWWKEGACDAHRRFKRSTVWFKGSSATLC